MARWSERFRIDPRNRRSFMLGLSALLIVCGIVLPVGAEILLHSRHAEVDALRTALAEVQDARGRLRERQAKKDAIMQRYANKAPVLAGFMDEKARAQKLEVADSVDRQAVPVGKRFTERVTVIHLKKAGMFAISKFLESVEQAGFPLVISRLNIRKRSGEPDSFDVELGLSAFDRIETKPAAEPTENKEKKP